MGAQARPARLTASRPRTFVLEGLLPQRCLRDLCVPPKSRIQGGPASFSGEWCNTHGPSLGAARHQTGPSSPSALLMIKLQTGTPSLRPGPTSRPWSACAPTAPPGTSKASPESHNARGFHIAQAQKLETLRLRPHGLN